MNRRGPMLLAVLSFYVLLLGWPLFEIVQGALASPDKSWRQLTGNPVFALDVKNTVIVTLLTTVVATVLGYILALAAWRATGTRRVLIFAFVLLPFWTGILVKNFAWTALLQRGGPIANLLASLGFGDVTLLHNRFAVVVGMVHYCIPYAVFPIFAAMLPLDRRLEQAASSLGAGRLQTARHIWLPLTLPGVLAGALLVSILSIGFFITPVLLGSPANQMVANLIYYYENEIVDFHTASLLALLVTAAVSLLVVLYQRASKTGQYGLAR